jgi:hypothetical protein
VVSLKRLCPKTLSNSLEVDGSKQIIPAGEINMPKKKRNKVKFEPNFETMELAMDHWLRYHPLYSGIFREDGMDIKELKNGGRRKGTSRLGK